MNRMNSKVDIFLSNVKNWREEMGQLRLIILDCGLAEELKWRVPCYTFNNSNIALLGGFKEFCAISFFKGVLLNDANNILLAPGKNSQSVRMIKFSNVLEIVKMESILKTYIYEAIEVEQAGLKVELKAKSELKFPQEFQIKLNKMPALKTAFNGLTPGRQRAYNLYFSAPKQSKSRESRIEKCMQKILNGKGLNDCICGLTKRHPLCDGSHKQLN